MAFFLLLWLLNATTEDQKQGISEYFSPSTLSSTTGGAGGLLGGAAVSSPGAMTSRTAQPSVSLDLKPTSGAQDGDADVEGGEVLKGLCRDVVQAAAAEQQAASDARAVYSDIATKVAQVDAALNADEICF